MTQETKHTPGPWYLSAGYHKVADGSPADWTVEGPRGDPVAFLAEETQGPRYVRDANARLIAAAPDLLEACRSALQYMESRGKYDTADLAAPIRAAIAKAEGGRDHGP